VVSGASASSWLFASGPPDGATTFVGVDDGMYSNFRESSVNVTGPYGTNPISDIRKIENAVPLEIDVTSLVRVTFIMAPNLPSVIWSQRPSESEV
jgi:hypothetical protein